MSPQRLRQLGILLVVLLFVWGTSEIIGGRGGDSGETLDLNGELGEIARVFVYENDGDSLLIRGVDGRWMVNEYPASATTMATLLRDLQDTAYTTSLVATSPSSHERMSVTNQLGRHFLLTDVNGTSRRLVFGENGPGFNERFVRLEDDDRVFNVRGRIVQRVALDLEGWRNRAMAQIEPGEIGSFTLRYGSDTVEGVVGEDGTWTFADGSPMNQATVTQFVDRFREFSATGFASPEEESQTNFERPDRTLELRTDSDVTLFRLDLVGAEDEGEFIARTGDGEIFKLPPWQMDRINPPLSSFRP